MSKSWQAYAEHILDAIGRIDRIKQRGDVTQDQILYDAALRNLQTMSEATRLIPDQIKASQPETPWKEISGFRNILVHDYLGEIDPQTIADVIENHLEPLGKSVRALLAKSSGE